MKEVLELDGIGASQPVTITSSDGPRRYLLRELTGGERANYLTDTRKRADATGQIKDFRGLQEDLVVRCLFDEETGTKVAKTVLTELPASTLQKLFEAAQEINGMGSKSEGEAAKN